MLYWFVTEVTWTCTVKSLQSWQVSIDFNYAVQYNYHFFSSFVIINQETFSQSNFQNGRGQPSDYWFVKTPEVRSEELNFNQWIRKLMQMTNFTTREACVLVWFSVTKQQYAAQYLVSD